MAKNRSVRKSDGPQSIGIRGEVTRYANQETANLGSKIDGYGAHKVWFMPGKIADFGHENTVFASYSGMPDFEKPMATFNVVKTKEGSVLKDRLLDQYPEVMKHWKDAMDAENGNVKRARERISSAGIVNSADIDQTKNLNILSKVLGLQTRSYFLQETVTFIPAPNLIISEDTYTEGSVAAKVSEGQEPALVTHSDARTTRVLYKNIGHIAITEEARLKSLHNISQLRQDKTLRDLARLINAQIGAILEAGTATGGADWGAVDATYLRSSNKPHNDIQTAVTTIRGNGFNVDYLAMHDRPALDLSSNDFIKGPGSQTSGLLQDNVDHFKIMGLPQVVIDQALTATLAIIGSKEGVGLGQGPTTIASYMNDVAGYEGWLAKQWWLPYSRNAGAFLVRTGISA
jgi:hypothetical protein